MTNLAPHDPNHNLPPFRSILGIGVAIYSVSLVFIYMLNGQPDLMLDLSGSFLLASINFWLLSSIVGRLLNDQGSGLGGLFLVGFKFLFLIVSILLMVEYLGTSPIIMAWGFTIPLIAAFFYVLIGQRQ
jgi:hypothetical protein